MSAQCQALTCRRVSTNYQDTELALALVDEDRADPTHHAEAVEAVEAVEVVEFRSLLVACDHCGRCQLARREPAARP
jgi:hypothetical protein